MEQDEHQSLLWAVQMQLAGEQLVEHRTPRCLVEVGSQGSRQGNFGRKLEGKVPLVVKVHGHSDEEVEEGGLPCEAVVACRKHQVHIRDEMGSPSGARNLGVGGVVGSKGHSEGEEVVCASGWEVPRRLGEVGSHSQVCHT